MNCDWRALCPCEARTRSAEGFVMPLESGRSQRVWVEDQGDTLVLWSAAARRSVVETLEEPALVAWERNRRLDWVGFRVDAVGRMIGEVALPKAGLTAEEFAMAARHLAAECDRFEFQLTGEDRE